MRSPLLHSVTRRCVDRSTGKSFGFSFYCDRCGKEFRSARQAFRTDSMVSPVNLLVVRMLWADQHRAAYELANQEAIHTFAYCPECGRWVCMECFYEFETNNAEICRDCLTRTKRKKRGWTGGETG